LLVLSMRYGLLILYIFFLVLLFYLYPSYKILIDNLSASNC
jgi:hypothetical protein